MLFKNSIQRLILKFIKKYRDVTIQIFLYKIGFCDANGVQLID